YIGPNKFSENEINLHIDRPEISIHAELKYSNQTPLGGWSLTAPGIMGWYRFVPRMECYHGVVSLDHDITGTIEIDGTAIDMTGGRGYIEKDWGSSMPSEWIWFQANSFSSPHSSVMFSVARIPWMGDSFPGFLAICHTDNHQHLFTTYNKSCISASEINNTTVHICFRNSSHELNIETSYTTAAELTAPVRGLMERSISESTDAQARIRLSTIDGYIEFEDRSNPAAIELAGPVQNLLRDVRACPGNRR
ncbi:MAG: tocopherol cyclase family protein, partial [Spirochaeta sp.]